MFQHWPFRSVCFLRHLFPEWNRSAWSRPARTRSAKSLHRRRSQSHASATAESLEPRQLLTVVSLTEPEQLYLEMINRARANPQAEAIRYGIDLNNGIAGSTISTAAKPPLAPNQSLVNAARGHTQDMLTDGFFDHNNPNTGSTPSIRAAAAGYSPILNFAENVAWNGTSTPIDEVESVLLNFQNLFLSPGHRFNTLSTNVREVGVGNLYGEFRGFNAGMVTQKFGNRGGNNFITGVVFTDGVVIDDFFTVGEAVPGVTVTITGSGINVSEQTGTSGAYSIPVPNGTYTVTLSGSAISTQSISNVVVASANRKVDFEAADGAIPATLTMQINPGTFAENAGTNAATGTVTRTGNLSQPLTVSLSSNDTTEATVPTSVTIAANQASQTFSINAVDDNLADGTRTVVLTASATGLAAVTSTISVTDYETFSPTSPLGSIFEARPTFRWPATAGAVRYEVWVKNLTTGQAPVVRDTQITSTSFTSPKNLDAATYRFWVRPYNVDGVRGEWSTATDFTVNPGPRILAPPTSTIQDARPVFRWASVSGVVRYELWVNNLTTGKSSVIRDTQIQSTQYRASELLGSGNYRVWVRGFNAENQHGAWSERLDFTIGPSILGPSGPQDTVAPKITWTGVEGTVRYDLWANNLTTGERQVIREPLLTGTTFTPSSALPAGRYRIWVRSFSSQTQPGPWSETVEFTIAAAPVVTAPQGLIGSETPTITWSAVTGAVSYDVRVITSSNGQQLFLETGVTGTTFESPVKLSVGTHEVSVRSVNADGDVGPWSVASQFGLIGTPQILTPRGVLHRMARPEFTWTAVEGASRYELWVNNLTTGESQILRRTKLTANVFQTIDPLATAEYRVWVRAFTPSDVAGPWSPRVDFRVVAGPTILSPLGIIDDSTPTFRWMPVENAVSYQLWVNNVTTGEAKVIDQRTIYATSYTNPQALSPGAYRAWTRGTDAQGIKGVWSEAAEFIVSANATPSSGIGGGSTTASGVLSFTEPDTNAGGGATTLRWTAMNGAVRYELEIATTSQLIQEPALTTSSFTLPDNLDNGDYRARVRAISADGTSTDWSSVVEFLVVAEDVGSSLSATQLLSPVGSTFSNRPKFTWKALEGITQYELSITSLASNVQQSLEFSISGTPEFTVPLAFPFGQYTAKLRPIDGSGTQGPWSDEVTFQVVGIPQVTSLSDSTTDRTPIISWTPIPEAREYEILFRGLSGQGIEISERNLTASSITPSNPLPLGTYSIAVRAYSESGESSPWSETIIFTILPEAL